MSTSAPSNGNPVHDPDRTAWRFSIDGDALVNEIYRLNRDAMEHLNAIREGNHDGDGFGMLIQAAENAAVARVTSAILAAARKQRRAVMQGAPTSTGDGGQ